MEGAGVRLNRAFGFGDTSPGRPPVRFPLVTGAPLREPVAWRGPIVMNTRAELIQTANEPGNGAFIRQGAAERQVRRG